MVIWVVLESTLKMCQPTDRGTRSENANIDCFERQITCFVHLGMRTEPDFVPRGPGVLRAAG